MGIWSWDVTTNAVTWSSNMEAMHGLPAGSFDGTFAFFERDIHDEDRPAVLAAIDETLRTGCPYRVRYRVAPRADGEERWIEAAGTLTIEDGAPKRMVGLCHDVTDRINLQQELRSRAKQQEALAQLGERALVETDIERLLNDVVSTVALTLPVDFVKVLELMPGDNELLLRAGFGWKAGCVGSIVMSKERDDYARHILGGRGAGHHRRFCHRDPVYHAALPSPSRLRQRHEHHDRRPGWTRLWRARRLHQQAAAASACRTPRSSPPSPISLPAPFNGGNWSNATN